MTRNKKVALVIVASFAALAVLVLGAFFCAGLAVGILRAANH